MKFLRFFGKDQIFFNKWWVWLILFTIIALLPPPPFHSFHKGKSQVVENITNDDMVSRLKELENRLLVLQKELESLKKSYTAP